ncbi:Beta-carbonic anhydrase 1 [bacterium HR29]|jgi:carbonic anhydrase|nr:Beta-carbonic anhydrase 1 [bacterium HR29]
MDVFERMVEANRAYAATFEGGGLPAPPRLRLAIVTCMDARIDPMRAFGLEPGDAHVIRNAGGRVADALRSLCISQQLLGTEAVAIVHHTGCGMATFRDDDLRERLRAQGVVADHVAFLPFRDVDQAVRDDIALYRSSPLVRQDIPVRGFVYDIDSGLLREVV